MVFLDENLETIVKFLETLLYITIPRNVYIKYDTENFEKGYFFNLTSIGK